MTGARRWCCLCWLLVLLAGCSALEEIWLSKEPFAGKQAREVQVTFAGNDSIGDRALRTAVRPDMMGLSQGLEAEAASYDAADAIDDYYRSQGFPDADTKFRIEGPTARADEPDLVIVHFAVTEGPAVTLDRLSISGNEHFAQSELLPLWSRRLSGALGLGSPYFVLADLRSFALAIRDYYRRHGWLEASVEGPDVVREPGASTATATLKVAEGRQFHFGPITVPPAIREALGAAMPKLPEGQVFTTLRAQELMLSLRSGLLQRGHPDPTVGMAPLPDLAALKEPVVPIEVRGDPGPTAEYGKVEVTGNERTRTGFITSRLGFAEGKPFDGIQEQKAEEKLYRTGLFQRVTIEHGDIVDGRMPVQVKVDEAEAQSVELLGGFGSYERLRAAARWEDRNLFGTGRELALETRASQKGYRGSATLTDRDLFDTDVTGSISGEVLEREYPAYTDRATGFTTALRRSLGGHVVARVGYGLSNHNTSTPVQSTVLPAEDFTDGSVFVELRRDDRDNIVLPRSGSAAFVRTDFTNPAFGADVQFNRLRTGLSWILPLGETTHFGVNGEAGGMWAGGGIDSVPVSERFFNGGYDSVRSFKQDRLGPKDANGTPSGGTYRNLFSVELRQRVYGPLEGSVFFDAGNVGTDVNDYRFDQMGYAVGVGMRLQLPIGPIRVDAGWNPDRNPGEDHLVVHFAIGYPF
jgi:outer membrane protein assembly complex protein YaeT